MTDPRQAESCACEQRAVIPLLSKALLAEYRTVLSDSELSEQYPQLEERRVKAILERLTYVADMVRSAHKRFEFPRDPQDAKLIEVAIGGNASHLITTDNDLLDLATGRDEAARRLRRRLPAIIIIKPDLFFDRYAILSEI